MFKLKLLILQYADSFIYLKYIFKLIFYIESFKHQNVIT